MSEPKEVLDCLIVGGGPAGTAAAFRLKERGVTALVIDYDDLMKRIRDYAKDKKILPNFGGGDKMDFPKGDELISALHFAPVDKDEMCTQWKGLYRRYNVPARVGLELMGLTPAAESGAWRAEVWNHASKSEECLVARQVVLAFGRGVPRRLDIPGGTEGMDFRLTEPTRYVGRPACVIGGGTSAAEAVIAISNAKADAGDESGIYWSYRGDKMPKVSKALADVFFEAYMGNGNVRYLPKSEPVSVVSGEEDREYLSIRTNRKALSGRPTETTQLEFLKSNCIACIGEDIPEKLLNSIGIYLMNGGSSNKKRIVVNPLLETVQPNVYLVGDILSPVYLEADDFEADPAGFRETKRRGNIKAALCDGVLVAEVIAQKLEGKTDINVSLEFAEAAAGEAEPTAEAAGESVAFSPSPELSEQAEATRIEVIANLETDRPRLVHLLDHDVEADEFALAADRPTTVGRRGCDITFAGDSMLSDRHASICVESGNYFLRDEGSTNGVFLRARAGIEREVTAGTVVKLGEQWLVFAEDPNEPSFVHYDSGGRKIRRYKLKQGTYVLGRNAPDVTLDPNDMKLSRRHLAVAVKEQKVVIRDLKSANGTFVKVDEPIGIEDGDLFHLGNQVLRFSLGGDVSPRSEVHFDSSSTLIRMKSLQMAAAGEVGPAIAEPVTPVGAADMVVTFKGTGQSFPLEKGQTICELAEKQGVRLNAECHQGLCGSDPVRIVSGKENLIPAGDEEEATLEDICGLAPGEHRLACMVRPKGTVEVEILE